MLGVSLKRHSSKGCLLQDGCDHISVPKQKHFRSRRRILHFVSQAQVDLWDPKKVNTQQQIPQLVSADRKEGQFVEFQMQQAFARSAFEN